MASFHYNPETGEVGPCKADVACPFGLPLDAHPNTAAAARELYEASMASQAVPEPVKATVPLKKSELAKLAKDTQDEAIVEQIIGSGSFRAVSNLLKNPHLTSAALEAIFDGELGLSEEQEWTLKDQAKDHEKWPLSRLTSAEFVAKLRKGQASAMLESDELSTEQFLTYMAMPKEVTRFGGRSVISAALSNSNNKVSTEAIQDAISTDWSIVGAAQRTGRILPDTIRNLDSRALYWGNVYQEKNEEYLRAYGDRLLSIPDKGGRTNLAQQLITNQATPADVINKIARSGLVEFDGLGEDKRLTAESRKIYLSGSATGRMIADLEALGGRDALKGELVVSSQEGGNPSRGWHTYSWKIDKEAVDKLGLSSEHMDLIFGRGLTQGHYDEVKGIYSGSLDSGD